jgi:hypothetical protein
MRSVSSSARSRREPSSKNLSSFAIACAHTFEFTAAQLANRKGKRQLRMTVSMFDFTAFDGNCS